MYTCGDGASEEQLEIGTWQADERLFQQLASNVKGYFKSRLNKLMRLTMSK